MLSCVVASPEPLHLRRADIAGHSELSAAHLCDRSYGFWAVHCCLVGCAHCATVRAAHGLCSGSSEERKECRRRWDPKSRLLVRICTRLYIFLYDCTSFSTSNWDQRARGRTAAFSWVAHNGDLALAHNGYDILFIFALRIQSANYLRFDFFDRYFLNNVGGRSRDQKRAFLGESRATISCS